jgi:hypothetical protein
MEVRTMNNQHEGAAVPATGEQLESVSARRKFLRTSGRVAIAAPAVVLLLSATTKSASAGVNLYGPNTPPPSVV